VANLELGITALNAASTLSSKSTSSLIPASATCSNCQRADTDVKDLAPESRGLEAIAEGFRLVFENDHELLERESSVYDGLYAYCQQIGRQQNERAKA
jgi:hypothetical protein